MTTNATKMSTNATQINQNDQINTFLLMSFRIVLDIYATKGVVSTGC